MSLSPEVYSAFAQKEGTIIFDSGGDPVGAISLGQYHSHFCNIPSEQLHVFLVVNPLRPLAETAEKAYALMEQVQIASRLKITGIINNANLVEETTTQELKTGYDVVKELSEKTGIPVYATAGTPRLLDEFFALRDQWGLEDVYLGKKMPIDVVMHRTWGRFLKEGL